VSDRYNPYQDPYRRDLIDDVVLLLLGLLFTAFVPVAVAWFDVGPQWVAWVAAFVGLTLASVSIHRIVVWHVLDDLSGGEGR
jgi:hypothetical protein